MTDLEKIVRHFAGEMVLAISAERGPEPEAARRALEGDIEQFKKKLMEFEHAEVMKAVRSVIDPTSRWAGDDVCSLSSPDLVGTDEG